MDARYESLRLSGVSAALRAFKLTRGLLALFGLAVLLAIATPGSRDALLGPALPPAGQDATIAPEAPDTPVPATATHTPEQRALAEFLSRRYRVAEHAIKEIVSSAYRAGAEHRVDPLLILAVVAVESRFNPVAESVVGAKGLMQVLPKFHQEKLLEHGGETALLQPDVNIQIGTQILREYLRRSGETEAALQMYVGAGDAPGSQYPGKVLAERARLEQLAARARRSMPSA